ncbi:hypothetical protein SDJN02_19620, partial [Cucurbita argyrosperma subsp. argyrosperma]
GGRHAGSLIGGRAVKVSPKGAELGRRRLKEALFLLQLKGKNRASYLQFVGFHGGLRR